MILITDDDATDRKTVVGYLEQLGHQVKEASTGEECLKLLKEFTFECLILDYKLPDYTGLDIVNKIRQDNRLPIIMITGRGDEFLTRKLLDLGVDDFIPKDKMSSEVFKVFITLVLAKNREREQLEAIINKLRDFLDTIQKDLRDRLK